MFILAFLSSGEDLIGGIDHSCDVDVRLNVWRVFRPRCFVDFHGAISRFVLCTFRFVFGRHFSGLLVSERLLSRPIGVAIVLNLCTLLAHVRCTFSVVLFSIRKLRFFERYVYSNDENGGKLCRVLRSRGCLSTQ